MTFSLQKSKASFSSTVSTLELGAAFYLCYSTRTPNTIFFSVFPTWWTILSLADVQGYGMILHSCQHPLHYNSKRQRTEHQNRSNRADEWIFLRFAEVLECQGQMRRERVWVVWNASSGRELFEICNWALQTKSWASWPVLFQQSPRIAGSRTKARQVWWCPT